MKENLFPSHILCIKSKVEHFLLKAYCNILRLLNILDKPPVILIHVFEKIHLIMRVPDTQFFYWVQWLFTLLLDYRRETQLVQRRAPWIRVPFTQQDTLPLGLARAGLHNRPKIVRGGLDLLPSICAFEFRLCPVMHQLDWLELLLEADFGGAELSGLHKLHHLVALLGFLGAQALFV